MNFLHDEFRNRMKPETVDKLTFIFINKRTMRRDKTTAAAIRLEQLTEKEVELIEDTLFESLEGGD